MAVGAEVLDLIAIFLLSVVPVLELRVSMPLAIALTDLNPLVVFSICVGLNLLVVPFAFKGLDLLAPPLIRRSKTIRSIFTWFLKRSYSRKWGLGALAAFVAVPLPGSGAYTGTLIAYLLGLNRKHAALAIAAGVIAAGVLVLLAVLGVIALIRIV